MKRTRAAERSPSAEEIQVWLVERVARQLGVKAEELDVREPLANYGMDSRTAFSLSGDLEEWLGRRHSPTLVWDYPTIEDIATHLAAENGAQQS